MNRYAQVAAVVRKLTRAPISEDERQLIVWMQPPRVSYGASHSMKNFVGGLLHCDHWTDAMRRYFWRIAYRYRRQIPRAFALEAEDKLPWAKAEPDWMALARQEEETE